VCVCVCVCVGSRPCILKKKAGGWGLEKEPRRPHM